MASGKLGIFFLIEEISERNQHKRKEQNRSK